MFARHSPFVVFISIETKKTLPLTAPRFVGHLPGIFSLGKVLGRFPTEGVKKLVTEKKFIWKIN